MVIILVHWQILKGREEDFISHWKTLTLSKQDRFYREILTKVIKSENELLNTFSLSDPNYTTFINVGTWESEKAFEDAVAKYIPKAEIVFSEQKKKEMKRVELELFEYKLRERIVLEKILDKEGNLPFPDPDIPRHTG